MGPQDYTTSPSCPAHSIPDSCYPGNDIGNQPFEAGCLDKVVQSYKYMGGVLGGIGITVALMQVTSLCLTIYLFGFSFFDP